MKLNLGCGTDIRSGYCNIDCADIPGVDMVIDFEKCLLPHGDGSVSKILCYNLLEHLETTTLLKEAHRVLKIGGEMHIVVPHFTSASMYTDPTHKKFFSIETFEFFTVKSQRKYYFDFAFNKVISRKITFSKRKLYQSS